MNYVSEVIAFLTDRANYASTAGNPIPMRLEEHLEYTLLALLITAVIAIPIGLAIGHTGRGRTAAVLISGGARALPTLGVLTLLALWLGIGLRAPIISVVILGIPSVLAGTYSGLEAIDRKTIDAARAVGMTGWQILTQVEIPLGLPLIVGGLRAAALQIVATVTLASYVGTGGLGTYIFLGLNTQDYGQMLAGSVLVVALALALEIVFSVAQRLVLPPGVSAGQRPYHLGTASGSRRTPRTPLQEGSN